MMLNILLNISQHNAKGWENHKTNYNIPNYGNIYLVFNF